VNGRGVKIAGLDVVTVSIQVQIPVQMLCVLRRVMSSSASEYKGFPEAVLGDDIDVVVQASAAAAPKLGNYLFPRKLCKYSTRFPTAAAAGRGWHRRSASPTSHAMHCCTDVKVGANCALTLSREWNCR